LIRPQPARDGQASFRFGFTCLHFSSHARSYIQPRSCNNSPSPVALPWEGSMSVPEATPDVLLLRARTEEEARGQLLEMYRNYLRLQARALLGTALQVRLDPSDLVQETFLDAHRDFASFQGATEAELLAWLRRILARNLADQARHHKAQGRDVRR